MINYLDPRKLRHAKGTSMSCAVQYTPEIVLYYTLFDCIFRSWYLVCFLFIMLSAALLSHKDVRPATAVATCFFLSQRETVTTVKGLLVPLYKLKPFVSNASSLSMASLSWYLVVFKFLVTTWSSLFISLRPEGRLYVSQLLSLAINESESKSSLEELLLESQIFCDLFHRYSRYYFSSFFHLFSYFLYCFTLSALLPTYYPIPSLMFWLVLWPVQSLSLCNIYFRSGIPAFLRSM